MRRLAVVGGLAACCVFAVAGCSRPYFSRYYGEHVKRVVLTPDDAPPSDLTFEQARDRWVVRLHLADPLASGSPDVRTRGGARSAKVRIWAILYDREVADAWIKKVSAADSISVQESARRYEKKHHPAEQFRVELKMESGLSAKSLDPSLWTIYLADEEETMYEPLRVVQSKVNSAQRRIYSEFHDTVATRHTFRRNVDLYFPRVTFFGKELLGPSTRLLRLVFARKQRTLGEAVWIFEAPQSGQR